jgi:hypothetical protein
MASGNRSKNAVPKIEPAEKLMRTKSIRSKVDSFKEIAKSPINEIRLTKLTAVTAYKVADIDERL